MKVEPRGFAVGLDVAGERKRNQGLMVFSLSTGRMGLPSGETVKTKDVGLRESTYRS